ncbi:MAG: hypothetical protein ACI9O5_002019, partial [Algoriphagus sp.]
MNIKYLASLLFIIWLCLPGYSQNLLIKGGWVFDTSSKSFLPNSGVYIQNGLFV